jgi:signal transduction histidine kinase
LEIKPDPSVQVLRRALSLYRKLLSLIRSRPNEAEVVRLVIDSLFEEFPGYRISFSRLKSDGQVATSYSRQPEKLQSIQGKSFLLGADHPVMQSLHRLEPIVCPDIRKDPRFRELLVDLEKYSGSIARVDFPLEDEGGRLNMISFTLPEPHEWDKDFVQLISELSELTSLLLREIRVREKLEITQARVVSNAKFVALGEMASGIAHEINNPLAVIHGTAVHLQERLRSGNVDIPLFSESMISVEKMANRISSVVKGLRVFSRQGAGEPLTKSDIRDVIEDTITMCSARMRASRISVEVVVPNTPLRVRCRPSEISQLLLNLISNAYDAVHLLADRRIRLVAKQQDGKVEVAVEDSGAGIPVESRERIFHPFFTTKEVGKGVGLGLSISKGLAEAHGGSLYFDANAPLTRFVFELPEEEP